MNSSWEWLIPAFIGTLFTGVGIAKFYGLWRGMVGGAGQPLVCRLCGT